MFSVKIRFYSLKNDQELKLIKKISFLKLIIIIIIYYVSQLNNKLFAYFALFVKVFFD